MQVGGSVGSGVQLADDLAVTQHHQMVYIHVGQGGYRMIETVEQGGIYALGFGRATRQFAHLG